MNQVENENKTLHDSNNEYKPKNKERKKDERRKERKKAPVRN
jgi:hypothetical protein